MYVLELSCFILMCSCDLFKDQLEAIERLVKIKVRSILCVPVYNPGTKQVMGIVCLINKNDNSKKYVKLYYHLYQSIFMNILIN